MADVWSVMVRVYDFDIENEEEFQSTYRLDGAHARSLKGVVCPKCGAWGSSGFEYPSADISQLDDLIPRRYVQGWRNSRPMTLSEYGDIKKKVEPLLGIGRPFMPGTELGPLRGNGSGKFDDFVWRDFFPTVLVREPVFAELEKAGFDLVGVPADIRFRRKKPEKIVELEIHPTAHLAPSICPESCEICGSWGSLVDPKLLGKASYVVPLPKLEGASFDDTIPLQRILEWPSIIVANEAFAAFISERSYSGYKLTPLELI